MADSKPEDRLSFFYRDQLFTDKFVGGGYIIRNDYEREKLHPPNKVIAEDTEVIFRGPDPLPTLGDAGRLARLVGLHLDRIVDDREMMLELHNAYRADLESLPVIADMLGFSGLDDESWNVPDQRSYIHIMDKIQGAGARNRSYVNYARFLGILAVADHLAARLRWDSVVYNALWDPYTTPTPFDTMGSMDTWHESFPVVLLKWRIYKRAAKAHVGVTSSAGSRLFTDATATFSETVIPGSLLVVNDASSSGDNGEYVVEEVHSDTELKVTVDWPIGSLTDLSYTVNWQIPLPDPYADFILNKFRGMAPACMRTMHRDETV